VFSNKKLFQSFLQDICAITLKINRVFSKSLLLIITGGRIRRMQIDEKPCFYHAVLAPQVRKQSVWLAIFGNCSDYTYYVLDACCILGYKPNSNFKSMRNAHARTISVSLRYCRLLFAPKYKPFFPLRYWNFFLFNFYLNNNLQFKRK